jgi:hypothetical protein
LLRALAFLVLLFGFIFTFAGSALATPVQLNIEQMLKKAEQQRQMPYIPARAGWNGPEERQSTAAANPEYQKLLDESSPAAARAALRKSAWPHWSVAVTIAMVIFTLRLLRAVPTMQPAQGRRATTGIALVPRRQAAHDGNTIPDNIPAREAA